MKVPIFRKKTFMHIVNNGEYIYISFAIILIINFNDIVLNGVYII